jgi:uncharacterized protein (DUF1800 family)
MTITSEWLARKLGYGYAFDEELLPPDQWIDKAKEELGTVPKYDPWRFIATNPNGRNLADLGLPDDVKFFGAYELKIDDLRYPDDLSRAVQHFLKLNSESQRLKKLVAEKKISERELQLKWWIHFNAFSWWRDTLTRGIEIIKGPTPVYNRFWHFWINHFAVNTESCEGELFGNYYITLRKNMTKKFDEFLFEAIWHPAMQEFLQNSQNVGPDSLSAKITRELKGNGPTSINENLARELLELYTVTPQAKYRQEDVNGVAYILTGWGAYSDNEHTNRYYQPKRRQLGDHKVMGRVYSDANGENNLWLLCKDLASHPLTAQFIAYKLARHFISDAPPKEAVDRIAKVFKDTNGSLVSLHRAVIDEVVSAGPIYQKFLGPELWFWQLHRSTKASLPMAFLGENPENSVPQINCVLYELGQLHSKTPQPNGWPDVEVEWLTPEYLDRRIRYSYLIAQKLSNSSGFDPKQYVERLPFVDVDLVQMVKRAQSYTLASSLLFCSDKFLRV